MIAQTQPRRRIRSPRPSLQNRGEKVRAQSSLDVRPGPEAQHVQSDQSCRVLESPNPIGGERFLHGGPDRSEDLVSCSHCQGHAGEGGEAIGVVHRTDVDRVFAAVQLLEHSALLELSGEALRHLPSEHGLDAGGVGFVLSTGEGDDT